jgi:hypothetical protein
MRISLLLKRVLAVVAVLCVAIGGGVAQAGETQEIRARATGQIIYSAPCGGLDCQGAVVSGQATHIGRITGILSEQINSGTGGYTGTAVFTTPSGDTIQTNYIGQILIPDGSGLVRFVEHHTLSSGTGKFEDASGDLFVTGSADPATLAINIDGVGNLTR